MSIKKKLLLAIFISFALVFIIVLAGWIARTHSIHVLRNATLVEQERMYLEMAFRGINESFLTDGALASITIAKNGLKGFEEAHKKLKVNLEGSELNQIVEGNIDPQWQRIRERIGPFLDVNNVSMSDDHLMMAYGELLSELEMLITNIHRLSEEVQVINNSTLRITAIVVLTTIIFMFGGTILVYVNLFHSIVGPIQNLRNLMNRVSVDEEGLMQADALTVDDIKEEEDGYKKQIIGPVTDIQVLYHSFGSMVQSINNYRDMLQDEIYTLSYYDRLTGLPNRVFFSDLLTRSISYAARYKLNMAVMLVSLNSFKRINETLGQSAGDQLLKEASERLTQSLRGCDLVAHFDANDDSATLSRMGGDEFILSLNRINAAEDAIIVAGRIAESMERPYSLDGHDVFCTVSIGISIFPGDACDTESLIKCSEAANHHVKSEGKSTYKFYKASMNESAYGRLVMEQELRQALENDEFEIYYQPKINPKNGKVVSVEALVRWNHPDKGFISPLEFISLAEETGLIISIGELVLRASSKQSREWQLEGFSPVTLAVNLSNRQIEDKGLLEMVTQVLEETQLPPEYLELEITESSIMEEPESSIALLKELKKLGISVAIDDFGTGYSSLHCLKQLPLDTLKVDRSFVQDINKSDNDSSIVKMIVAMARSLNLKVVAEGVEKEEQLVFLRDLGCDEIQGYLFSPPIPAKEFRKFLEQT